MSQACGAYVRMLEAGLGTLRVIETDDDQRPGEVTIVFHVYKSPRDAETVVGEFASGLQSVADDGTSTHSADGVPVAEAFLQCHAAARNLGADAIRVDDPNGLFPLAVRPDLPSDC